MSKEEWIDRCAKRYVEKGGATKAEARGWAEEYFEEVAADGTAPEEAADEDMACWGS